MKCNGRLGGSFFSFFVTAQWVCMCSLLGLWEYYMRRVFSIYLFFVYNARWPVPPPQVLYQRFLSFSSLSSIIPFFPRETQANVLRERAFDVHFGCQLYIQGKNERKGGEQQQKPRITGNRRVVRSRGTMIV